MRTIARTSGKSAGDRATAKAFDERGFGSPSSPALASQDASLAISASVMAPIIRRRGSNTNAGRSLLARGFWTS